jgi:hypothetical protein
MQKTGTRVLRAAAVAMLLAACGGGQDRSPAAPPPPPVPTPTPGPPAYVPFSASCARLPAGSSRYTCREDPAHFHEDVFGAIDVLKNERPEFFNGETILNMAGYYAGLVQILDRRDLCAHFDGQELAVKQTNDFSEQYRLQTSWRTIRRAYMGVCYPAWFPVADRVPPPSPAGCALAPSYEVACDRASARFPGEVEKAIDQVLQQRPALFDFSQTAPGTDWPLLRDFAGYHAAVVEALVAMGFCAMFDGAEIQLKRTNEFSEHYDVNYADAYVRRGAGAYRSSCYPAAF